ncbi:hypothetical protein [Leptolyngbya sp. BC1307]|jgi:hypothetical protein|nr:hypothetical protein [Leptolyngbya sp. BC1307]
MSTAIAFATDPFPIYILTLCENAPIFLSMAVMLIAPVPSKLNAS